MKDLNELHALIRLADEPDEKLFLKVKNRILEYGLDALAELEAARDNAFDLRVHDRISSVVHEIRYQKSLFDLQEWAMNPAADLLQACALLTNYQFPSVNVDAFTREVGRIAQEVWLELNVNLTALEKVKVLNHILFDINRFSGDSGRLNSPETYFLNHLLEHRKGNQMSIGILYLIIARSLHIPIYGVDLPRHFVLAYTDHNLDQQSNTAEVLFYLNPLNKGAIFTRKEIELFIKQLKLKPEKRFFEPCSNLSIIEKLLTELQEIYLSEGDKTKVSELEGFIRIIQKKQTS